MSQNILLSPQGVFPDVCPSAWGCTVAFKLGSTGPLVIQRRDVNGNAISGEDIGTGMPDSTFPRVCQAVGKTWVAYRAFRNGQESAVVREVRQDGLGAEQILGPTFGNNPVCLSAEGLVAWQGHGLAVVHGLRLEDGETIILRTETRPTGLAHLNGDHPVFVDENRLSEPGMLNPVRSGALTVGEGPESGLRTKLPPKFGQILGGECFVPRCADFGEDRYAAVTWGPGVGATLVLFQPADIQPIPVDPPVEPIPDVNRKLWFGSYDRDHNGTFPGNCRIRWSEGQPAVLEDIGGQDIAYYVSGNPDGDPEAIELACQAGQQLRPELPVLAYVPGGVSFPPSADWIGLEAYHKVWETLQQFEAAIRSAASFTVRPIVLIGQCYTSNQNNTKQLRPLVPVFGRFLRDIEHCKGFVAFSAGHWRATGFEDHPEVHPLYRQLSRTIQTPDPDGDGGGGPVVEPVIEIIDYDKKVSRKDPKGCLIRFDVSSPERIVKLTLQMEGDGEPPVAMHFPSGPDGRYVRALAFKPVRTGHWFGLVKAWDESGRMGTTKSATKIEVTEGDEEPPPVNGDLDDQLELVTKLRKQLFPDKFQPGHPQANPDGFLPLHDIEKAALWAKHVAWELRSLGVGMVKAKPGSQNHGGANTISPGGFTTDIVATADGVHWDFQIDGAEGAAYPTWAMEEDESNYPPVAARWVPAFPPNTP